MNILVFEDNLLWSSRMMHTLKSLGHEPRLCPTSDAAVDGAKIAIVNLASPKLDPEHLVPRLRANGVHVIGHAGHKEKDLMQLGKVAGCDTLATNSELTFKIEALLERINGTLDLPVQK